MSDPLIDEMFAMLNKPDLCSEAKLLIEAAIAFQNPDTTSDEIGRHMKLLGVDK